jgi:hypothetical protein
MTSRYVTPPGVPPPPGPYVPPGGYAPSPQPPPTPPNRGLLITAGLVTAILLATAALVVGIIAISRPTATTSAIPAPPSGSPTATATDTGAADRKLCEAVAPLIRESADAGRGFVNLGPTGTPARDAGIPKYQASVSDWVERIQPILDQHPDADAFFKRTLQRFIDDTRIYATSIRPGPETDADAAAWNDKLVAIGGPFDVCHRLGVQW